MVEPSEYPVVIHRLTFHSLFKEIEEFQHNSDAELLDGRVVIAYGPRKKLQVLIKD